MYKSGQFGVLWSIFESRTRNGGSVDARPSARRRAHRPRKLNVEALERRELLALSAVGPIDPVNGLPRWYQDRVGVALELCLDNMTTPPGLCLTEEANTAAPISFPDNFTPEAFYTRVDSDMVTNGGGLALLVGATEAVNEFAPPALPVLADSFVFGRLRFRVDNLVAGETYTIIHPWGMDSFVAQAPRPNAPPVRMINDTVDIGCVPGVTPPGTCDFTVALSPLNKVDTYVKWDPAVAPLATPGFIGNFAIPHTIVGSGIIHPTLNIPQNFFRIEGPNVGGPNSPNPCPDRPGDPDCIQTDLFNVMGKIAVGQIRGTKYEDLNGNGVREAGEPGLAGWTINLDGPGGPRTTVTLADNPATPADDTGRYVFPGLDPGTYTVSEVLQAGWTQSAPAGGVHTVPLGIGEIVENMDFGNFRPGSIQGMKFNDLDRDGVKDANEPGLPGWTITLTGPAGSASPVNLQTDTVAGGTYSFTGLQPGTYTLSEVQRPGFSPTTPPGGTTNVAVVSGQTTTLDFGNAPPIPGLTAPIYFSLGSNATVRGLSVANEDIVFFNGGGLSLFFDGSDVGLGSATLDAFAIISPTETLMSFTSSRTVTGISGTVDDSDIVKFTATSLGQTTSGTFSLYFDGSDVELTNDSEDVDAIELLSNGHLLLSTTGTFSVTGVSCSGASSCTDVDIIEFTPTSLGATTAGSYSLYFDGSDVALSPGGGEDVDALAVDASGRIYLSTTGSFTVPGLTGADEDAFVFTPSSLGVNTAGTYGPGLFVDGSMFGIGGNDIMGIDLPSSALLAAGSMGSGIVPGLSPVPMGMVLPGPLTVSIDGNVTAEQRDRIRGAIDVLNGTGAMLTLADTTSAAIRLHHGAISPCGGMSAGVLGCATAPGDITLIAGWNWYTGSDTNSIGSDQYDYQTIVTHELAHIVGLHHSDDPSSALYHSLSPGVAHRDLVHDAALEDFHAHDLV